MSLQELIDALTASPLVVLAVLAGTVALAYVVGIAHGRGRGAEPPWRYVYAFLVYAACVPGVFATLLTAYTLLFLRGNLLRVDALVYFAPIVTMGATLVIIRRNVDLDAIPGFDRLTALVLTIALTFFVVFALSRLFFGVFFFGSIGYLIALSVFAFALIRWGLRTAFRSRGAPRPVRPSLR